MHGWVKGCLKECVGEGNPPSIPFSFSPIHFFPPNIPPPPHAHTTVQEAQLLPPSPPPPLTHTHTWKGILGMSSRSFSSRRQGHSCRKRSDTSNVAPPHISREPALASTEAVAGPALSMSKVRMRVASRDWCASRLQQGGGGGIRV